MNTGRNLADLEEFNKTLPEICYLNCISGALVYDLKENVVSKNFWWGYFKKTIRNYL